MGRPKKNLNISITNEIEYPKSYKDIMKKNQGWYYQKGDPSTRVYYKTPNEAGIAIYGKQSIKKRNGKNGIKNEKTKDSA